MLPAAGSAWARWWPRTTQLLGHGLAVQALRADGLRGRIGITNACTPVRAASAEPADVAAAARYDAVANGCCNDPVLLGRYPAELAELAPAVDLSAVRAGDLAVITAPLDFLGINYYFPTKGAGRDRRRQPDGRASGAHRGRGADRVRLAGRARRPARAAGRAVRPVRRCAAPDLHDRERCGPSRRTG